MGPDASQPQTGVLAAAVHSPQPTAEQLTSPVQAAGPSAVQDDSDQRPRHGRPEADHHPPEPKRSRLSISSHADSHSPALQALQQQQQVAGQQLTGSEGRDSRARQLAGSYSIEQLMQPQAASFASAAGQERTTAIPQASNAQAGAADAKAQAHEAGALPDAEVHSSEPSHAEEVEAQTPLLNSIVAQGVIPGGARPAIKPEVGPWHQQPLQIRLAAAMCASVPHVHWQADASWHILPEMQRQCSLIFMCHRVACNTVRNDCRTAKPGSHPCWGPK